MSRVASCIQAANASLGEGPSWDHDRGVLYWIDIRRPAVFRWEEGVGQSGHWPMPNPIGCVCADSNGELIFADTEGFGILEIRTGSIARLSSPESALPGNRFNDGKTDRAGRLWAGTMDDRCLQPSGSLYRLDPDLSVHKMDTGFICSNGLGWSPDNRTMYFTDSMTRTIWEYEFELRNGTLGTRRIFAQLPSDDGVPDGLTVDSAGFVWSAIWDGWRLIRFAPDGTIDREVPMPVQRPTSCAFGGRELRTLYVTSACWELDAQSLRTGPLAGGLFALETDIPGIPEVSFRRWGR